MAKVSFTAGRVAGFKCPPDKKQAFMWDATTPGLGLRATPTGKPAYVFQGVYQGKDVRITIGSPAAWSIPDAQAKARELQRLIDEGRDPRELKRSAIAEAAANDAAAAAQVVTVGEAWTAYIEARRAKWGDSHHQDHHRYAQAGGEPKKRGKGKTEPGPLYPLMSLPLRDMSADQVQAWAEKKSAVRPTVTRNSWRLLLAQQAGASTEGFSSLENTEQVNRIVESLGKSKAHVAGLAREFSRVSVFM